MAELAALLEVRCRPHVSDHVAVVFVARPLLSQAAGAGGAGGGGGAGDTPRVSDGVDRPVGVRHEVTGHSQLRPQPLRQEAVVLRVRGVAVAEGVAVGLAVTAS